MIEKSSQEQLSELAHAVKVSEHLYRITAPNPGFMTGNGTNTYIVSKDGKFAVIDPGPIIDAHIKAILAFTGGVEHIGLILVTHMHPDHSPLAKPLAEMSGAVIVGWNVVDDEYQDETCHPDHLLEHDEIIPFMDLQIRAIHTPGHVDNHVCYLLEGDEILLTGDHIMQGSTVVIIPPHGKMKEYIASLELLNNYEIKQLAPGHGDMILTPKEEINGIIQHRLAREKKVVNSLQQLSRASMDELTEVVYSDVDRSLHPMARLSLLAHLIKLKEENKVVENQDKWVYRN